MICDLAETYHILNYKELPPMLVATLVLGLRENSRVKMRLGNIRITFEQMLLATAADNLAFLSWSKTKDAQKGRNRPKSILETVLNNKPKEEYMTFKSAEELEEFFRKVDEK